MLHKCQCLVLIFLSLSFAVVNHQSSVDVLGLFYLWSACGRLSIVGKKELLYLGPFGLACYCGGMTFIDRKLSSEALTSLTEAVIQNKEQGVPVLVFPEGTRNQDRYHPSLLPFKKGAFVAAIQAQVHNLLFNSNINIYNFFIC